MTRRLAARIAVPLAAAAVLVAATAPGGRAQTPGARSLTLTESAKSTKTVFVDSLARGLGVGDTIDLAIPLSDAGGASAGTATATCTVTRAPKKAEPSLLCQGVYALAGGDLMVSGRVVPGPDRLAVTGGTGTYAGARGTMTSTDTKTGATDELVLLP